MNGKTTPSIELGSLPNQFHQPSDGLGHLLLFPVEELEQQANRLLAILEESGLQQEVIHEEGNWKRLVFSNPFGDVNMHIIDELFDINRAMSIGRTLGPNMFRVIRNGILSQKIELDDNIQLSSFITDVGEIEKMSPLEMRDQIIKKFHVIIDYMKSWEIFFTDPEKFKKSLKFWSELDPAIISRENFDKTYQDIFHDFVEGIIADLDGQGKIESQKKNFYTIINGLIEDDTDGGLDLETFLKWLELEGMRDTFQKNFMGNQEHEDRYPSIEYDQLTAKSLGKTVGIIQEPVINQAIKDSIGLRTPSLKTQLYGSTSM